MDNPLNVLVLEENASQFELVESRLRRVGLNVTCVRVETLQELASALSLHRWHVAITDCDAPALDGRDAVSLLRNRAPDLPVIVLTGHMGEDAIADLFRIGVADLVLKDRLAELAPAVERCVREQTERNRLREAERALREHEERLRLALHAARMNAFEYDPHTDWVRRTGGLSQILDLPPEGSGAAYLSQMHPDDREAYLAVSRTLSPANPAYQCEFRMQAPDGQWRWVEENGEACFDEHGALFRIRGVRQDITERRQTEERLRQVAAAFMSTQEGVAITDLAGNILCANPAFTTITEYEEHEYSGQNIRILASGRQNAEFFGAMWTAIRATGGWHGEIWNRRKSGEIYPQWLTVSTVRDQTGKPVNYVGVFTDISRINHSESHLEHLAHHDALTGLPNRTLLRSRLGHSLDRARRSGPGGAVLFIDLDRFKAVNDNLGHRAGDELLQMVAARLRSRLRDADTLARWGGDEFVAVLEEVPRSDIAGRVAEELIELLNTPFHVAGGREAFIGGSVGISLFPQHGEDPESLIHQADTALYRAKAGGRNQFIFYAPETNRRH